MSISVRTWTLFCDTYYCTKRWSISPNAKVLIALKVLAYKTLPASWLDYFQMSDSCAQECIKHLVNCLVASNLSKKYLCDITTSDVTRVTKLHKEKQGVPGMLGSIDCTHFSGIISQCDGRVTSKVKIRNQQLWWRLSPTTICGYSSLPLCVLAPWTTSTYRMPAHFTKFYWKINLNVLTSHLILQGKGPLTFFPCW